MAFLKGCSKILMFCLQILVIANTFVSSNFISKPPCDAPENSDLSWISCQLDKNHWYGITNERLTPEEAVESCQSINAEFRDVAQVILHGRDEPFLTKNLKNARCKVV